MILRGVPGTVILFVVCVLIVFFRGGEFIVDNFLKLGSDRDTARSLVKVLRFLAFLGMLASAYALFVFITRIAP